ncbi:MAG: ATP-binding cassette domain-containing protein [Oceanicaulis sp.]
MLQIGVLGAGAALAIHQEMSAGAIVAASILMGRALAPIDQLVGGWRTLSGARIAWRRLTNSVPFVPVDREDMPVPTPEALIEMEDLAVGPPGSETILIRPFSLRLTPGSLTVLIGPNGAGKSTLLRTLIGVWPPAQGEIRFGGRAMHSWSGDDRGRHVGYLPQEIELLPGSVRDNIARFDPAVGDQAVLDAAVASGAHDAILRLPNGYDTRVGPGGIHISPGQAQLIALARAFAGSPRFVVLDEPTSNLDHRASNCVVAAIEGHIQTGAALLISTHDPRLIRASHSVLALDNGRLLRGKPDDFLAAPTHGATRSAKAAEGGAA